MKISNRMIFRSLVFMVIFIFSLVAERLLVLMVTSGYSPGHVAIAIYTLGGVIGAAATLAYLESE